MKETQNCTYKTPCGWCSKWDKKCDEKISEPQVKQHENFTNKTCQSEDDHEWELCGMSTGGSNYICKKCRAYKVVPYTNSTIYEATLTNI